MKVVNKKTAIAIEKVTGVTEKRADKWVQNVNVELFCFNDIE